MVHIFHGAAWSVWGVFRRRAFDHCTSKDLENPRRSQTLEILPLNATQTSRSAFVEVDFSLEKRLSFFPSC